VPWEHLPVLVRDLYVFTLEHLIEAHGDLLRQALADDDNILGRTKVTE
jgi:hypothetical protein